METAEPGKGFNEDIARLRERGGKCTDSISFGIDFVGGSFGWGASFGMYKQTIMFFVRASGRVNLLIKLSVCVRGRF